MMTVFRPFQDSYAALTKPIWVGMIALCAAIFTHSANANPDLQQIHSSEREHIRKLGITIRGIVTKSKLRDYQRVYATKNNPNNFTSPDANMINEQGFVFSLAGCFKDLKKLAVFKHLKILNLNRCRNADISGIKYLPNLEQLTLGRNRIKKIEGLEGLRKLRYLDLAGNDIQVIENLGRLRSLKKLFIHGNPLTNIEGLRELTGLQYLQIGGDGMIKSFAPLQHLTKLRYLAIVSEPVESLEVLANMKTLRELNINESNLKSMRGIEKLKNLRELILVNNQIERIQHLEQLSNLRYLSISESTLKKIEGLDSLKNLESLSLRKNQITKIENITPKKLQYLNLDQNQITKIENIGHLRVLKELSMIGNNLDSVAPLFKMPNLLSFDVVSSDVRNGEELAALEKLLRQRRVKLLEDKEKTKNAKKRGG